MGQEISKTDHQAGIRITAQNLEPAQFAPVGMTPPHENAVSGEKEIPTEPSRKQTGRKPLGLKPLADGQENRGLQIRPTQGPPEAKASEIAPGTA